MRRLLSLNLSLIERFVTPPPVRPENQLTFFELADATDRPIIFALVYSASRMGHNVNHLRSVFVSTYGILFMATPHDGSDKARLGSFVQRLVDSCLPTKLVDTSPQLVASIATGSEVLQEITDNFVPLMSRFCMYFFWEQHKTDLKFTSDYTIEYAADPESTEDPDSASFSTQPTGTFTADPARSSRSTGFTSIFTTETQNDEEVRNGNNKDTRPDSAVLAEAVAVPCLSGSAQQSIESLSSAFSATTALLAGKWTQSTESTASTAPNPPPRQGLAESPVRTSTPGALNRRPSGSPRVSAQNTFPHAWERRQALSAHWEDMTSSWIRKLQENADELHRRSISNQLSRQVGDLSAVGANLFHAVTELQRLQATSERKFQKWFFETWAELERNQEVNMVMGEQLQLARDRPVEDVKRERELADEVMQSRAQLQRDLDCESSRFAAERTISARLRDDLQKELSRLVLERRVNRISKRNSSRRRSFGKGNPVLDGREWRG
ncbi:hypothetical protein OQA88_10987 [Cercophora sp. LCS_1]